MKKAAAEAEAAGPSTVCVCCDLFRGWCRARLADSATSGRGENVAHRPQVAYAIDPHHAYAHHRTKTKEKRKKSEMTEAGARTSEFADDGDDEGPRPKFKWAQCSCMDVCVRAGPASMSTSFARSTPSTSGTTVCDWQRGRALSRWWWWLVVGGVQLQAQRGRGTGAGEHRCRRPPRTNWRSAVCAKARRTSSCARSRPITASNPSPDTSVEHKPVHPNRRFSVSKRLQSLISPGEGTACRRVWRQNHAACDTA